MAKMRITLSKDKVLRFASAYNYDGDEELGLLLRGALSRGCLTRSDLIEVAKWKWKGGRTRNLAAQNSEEEVQEISRASFSASGERMRIGTLLSLDGVNWPMASVILHFAFEDRYPILDVRAMKAVNGSTHYTFARWLEYAELCRATATRLGVSMRTLDRALWVAGE